MPKYVYYCKECKELFEIKHSLQKICKICELCKVEGQLERRPSTVFISKKQSNFGTKTRAGEVVKTTIEEAKQDLEQERKRLGSRTYQDDK